MDDAQQLSRFMQHVDGNLSSEIGRPELHDWPDTMWSRRYQSIVVSGEEAAQVERLRYHLARAWSIRHLLWYLLWGEREHPS